MRGQFNQPGGFPRTSTIMRLMPVILFYALAIASVSLLAGCAVTGDGSAAGGTHPLGSAPKNFKQVVRGQPSSAHGVKRLNVAAPSDLPFPEADPITAWKPQPAVEKVAALPVQFSTSEAHSPVDRSAFFEVEESDHGQYEPVPAMPEPLMPPSIPAASDWMPRMDEEEFPTRYVALSDVLMLLRESPRMVALRANINVALADRTQAGLLPNPEFSYSRFVTVTGDNDAANDPDEFGLSELCCSASGAAIRTAELEITATQAEVFAEYADLVIEARRLFATLLVREEMARVLAESLTHFERVERLVQGRFEEGDVSEYDLERIRVEVATFRSQLVGARAELADASGELASLLASPGWLPMATGALKPLDVRFDYAELAASMQQVHPRIQAARNREFAARSGIILARKERLPRPQLETGWWNAQAPVPNTAGALFVGISVPTPLFDRGQGTIARAQAEATRAAYERQTATDETQAQLQSALAVLSRLRQTLNIYEQQIRGRLPRLREMAEEGYEAGEIQIIELLDAINVYVEPQLTYLELLEAVMHAEIDVLSASGMVEAYLEP